MRVQIVRPEELRLTANGPGVPGQEGVIYQTPRNGSTMSRAYIWNGERHVQFGQPEVESLVSTPGNQPSATLAATVGTPGQIVRLADGPDAGAILVWAIPLGASAYTWCWWLSPTDAY